MKGEYKDPDYMKKYRENNRERANAHAKEYFNWIYAYSLDMLELVKRYKVCICCGDSPVELDHIVPRPRTMRYDPIEKLRHVGRGNIQLLCSKCNKSKGDGSTCYIHNKYLGLWNHLPFLENMEEV